MKSNSHKVIYFYVNFYHHKNSYTTCIFMEPKCDFVFVSHLPKINY